MEDNKRKLYDALSEDYDLGSFEQFSADIADDAKRRRLYDAASEDYDFGDYDTFSSQLGFGKAAGAVQAPPAVTEETVTENFDDEPDPRPLKRSRREEIARQQEAMRREDERARSRSGKTPAQRTSAFNEAVRRREEARRSSMTEGQIAEADAQEREAVERRRSELAEERRASEDVQRFGTGGGAYSAEDAAYAGRLFEDVSAENEALNGDIERYNRTGQGDYASLNERQRVLRSRTEELQGTPAWKEYVSLSERYNALKDAGDTPENRLEMSRVAAELSRNPIARVGMGADAPSMSQIDFDTNRAEADYIESQMETADRERKKEYKARLKELNREVLDNEYYQEDVARRIAENGAEREGVYKRMSEIRTRVMKEKGKLETLDEALLAEPEYQRLLLASAQLEQTGRKLEHIRDKNAGDFWVNFMDVFSDPNTYNFGITNLETALATKAAQVQNDNGYMSPSADGAVDLLSAVAGGNAVAQEEGKYVVGKGKYGQIAAQSIPFMFQIGLTGGFGNVANAVSGRVTRALGDKFLVKATGAVLGDLSAGFVAANTIGGAKTMTDVLNSYYGTLVSDGEDGFRYEGGQGLGRSVWGAEVGNTIEFASERAGDHMQHLLGRGILGWGIRSAQRNGRGAVNLAVEELARTMDVTLKDFGFRSANRAGANWAQKAMGTMFKALNQMGVQGLPFEVAEEYVGLLGNIILGGEEKWMDFSKLGDKETHTDIWGGMLYSVGLTQAGAVALGGVGAGVNGIRKAQAYHQLENALEANSGAASVLLGDEWKGIKETIDGTTNKDLPKKVVEYMDNPAYDPQQRAAILDYVKNTYLFRGFNAGTIAQARERLTSEDNLKSLNINAEAASAQDQISDAYMLGYQQSTAKRADIEQADLDRESRRSAMDAVEQREEIARAVERQKARMAGLTGVADMTAADASAILDDGTQGQEMRDAALDYLMALAVERGFEDAEENRQLRGKALIEAGLKQRLGGAFYYEDEFGDRNVETTQWVNPSSGRPENIFLLSGTPDESGSVPFVSVTGRRGFVTRDQVVDFDEAGNAVPGLTKAQTLNDFLDEQYAYEQAQREAGLAQQDAEQTAQRQAVEGRQAQQGFRETAEGMEAEDGSFTYEGKRGRLIRKTDAGAVFEPEDGSDNVELTWEQLANGTETPVSGEPAPAPQAAETPAEETAVEETGIPLDKDGNPIYDAPGVSVEDALVDMYSYTEEGLDEADVDEYILNRSAEAEKGRAVKQGKMSLREWAAKKKEANRIADFWGELAKFAEENRREREDAEKKEAVRQRLIEQYGVDTSGFDLTPQTAEEAVAEYLSGEKIINLDDAVRETLGKRKDNRIPTELFRHLGAHGILTKDGGLSVADAARDIVGEFGDTVAIDEDEARDLIITMLLGKTKSEIRDVIFNNRLDQAREAAGYAEAEVPAEDHVPQNGTSETPAEESVKAELENAGVKIVDDVSSLDKDAVKPGEVYASITTDKDGFVKVSFKRVSVNSKGDTIIGTFSGPQFTSLVGEDLFGYEYDGEELGDLDLSSAQLLLLIISPDGRMSAKVALRDKNGTSAGQWDTLVLKHNPLEFFGDQLTAKEREAIEKGKASVNADEVEEPAASAEKPAAEEPQAEEVAEEETEAKPEEEPESPAVPEAQEPETQEEKPEEKPENVGKSGEKPVSLSVPGSPSEITSKEEARAYFENLYGKGKRADNSVRVWELTHKKKSAPANTDGEVSRMTMSLVSESGLSEEEASELVTLGTQLAEDYITEDGLVKFPQFFKNLVETFGDGIRPFAKQIYLGASANVSDELVDQMDDRKAVRAFDTSIDLSEISDEQDITDIREGEQPVEDLAGNSGEGAGEESVTDGSDGDNSGDTGEDSTPGGSESTDSEGAVGEMPGDSGNAGESDNAPGNGEGDNGGANDRGGSRRGTKRNGGRRGRTSEPVGESEPGLGRDTDRVEDTEVAAAEAEQKAYDEEKESIKEEADTNKLKSRKDDLKSKISAIAEKVNIEKAKLSGQLRAVIERLRELFSTSAKKSEALAQEKVPYSSASDPTGEHAIGSVVPSGSADAMRDAIKRLEAEEGKSVAEFVKDELGYASLDEMFSSETKNEGLSAEQVDSVGLAIHQMKKGKMFIIGDMTGIGKGRQGAALIRWSKRQGKKVLFVTEKPDLFSDMYQDLADIGTKDLLPWIVNSDSGANITDKNSEDKTVLVKHPGKADSDTLYKSDSGELPTVKRGLNKGKQYDFVMMTYSQAQGARTTAAERKLDWIKKYAKDAIVICDESHNASGDSNRGKYFQDIVKNAQGVTFSSATFAKRPDNMVLYALRSSIGDAQMTQEDMIKAIQQYGIPMQEILAASLFKTGEMVRRERDFSDVKTHWYEPKEIYSEEELGRSRQTFDKSIGVVNDIIDFQRRVVDPIIKKKNEDEFKEKNELAAAALATTGEGTFYEYTTTPYSGQVSNVAGLMFYSIKAQKAADMAIEQIKKGEKPVIAVENTLESYLKDIDGDVKSADFAFVLNRGLNTALKHRLKVTTKRFNPETKQIEVVKEKSYVKELGSVEPYFGEPAQASLDAVKASLEEYSEDKEVMPLMLSPIDYIKKRIEDAGYKCGEITGRSLQLVQAPDGTWHTEPYKTDKKKAISQFNGGETDALILNTAGSTGISLHASRRFKDQKKRNMIILQPARDPNTEVQIRGRVDRTGQVSRAEYFYITSPIPAEQKVIMMLRQKLASLDANSVGTENVSSNRVNADDMDNKYGDEIARQFLIDHPEINDQLDKPLQEKKGEYEHREGLLYQLLIGIQRMTCEEQEMILGELQSAYRDQIEYLNQNGINDLSTTTMNLEAVTIDKGLFIKGKDNESMSEFAHDTNIERVEVNVLNKPLRSSDINARMKKLGALTEDGKIDSEYGTKMVDLARAYIAKAKDERQAKHAAAERKLEQELREQYPKPELQSEADYEKAILSMPQYTALLAKNQSDYERFSAELDRQSRGVFNIARYCKPGMPMLVPLTDDVKENAPMSYGRFIGFKIPKDGKPNGIKAVFAVKDSRASIEIPIISKGDVMQSVIDNTYGSFGFGGTNLRDIGGPAYDSSITDEDRRPARDEWWDKMIPKDTNRQLRYMVTGNILQACGSLGKYKGTITTFTRKDPDTGEITVERGMLLAEDFDPENFEVRSAVTKEDVWDGYDQIRDEITNIGVRREGEKMIVTFDRKGREKLANHPIMKDDGFKALIDGGEIDPYSRDQLRAYVSEGNVEAVLDYLYKNYSFTKGHQFVMPDSTERVDAIVYTDKPYKDVIDEFGTKYNASEWTVESKIKKAVQQYKMDVNNEDLKTKIRELVQLRQAYYRKRYAKDESSRLAWNVIIYDQRIEQAKDDKDMRDEAYAIREAIKEELAERGVHGNAMHFESGKVPIDTIIKTFNDLNKNKANADLAKRIFALVKKLKLDVIFNEKIHNSVGGQTAGQLVEYNWKYMNAEWITDQMKADTILHELVHTVTVYAKRLVDGGYEHLINQDIVDAVQQLDNIYRQIRYNKNFTHQINENGDSYTDYGVQDWFEMMAEAGSNENFRDDLKRTILGVKVMSGIISFSDVTNRTDYTGKTQSAYDAIKERLDVLIDNFSEHGFTEFFRGSMFGERSYNELYRSGENLSSPIDRARAITTIDGIAKKLGVEFEQDSSLKAKGAFNPKTGKIRINIDAHKDTSDLEATLLHEAVAHYGLRKLFKEDWPTVRKKFYEQATDGIKAKVDALAKQHGLSKEVAMEEYIASLAEDGRFDQEEETFWQKVVTAIKRMLHKIGFNAGRLTDEDFRALLYASFANMREGGPIESAAKIATYQSLRKMADSSHEEGPDDEGPDGGGNTPTPTDDGELNRFLGEEGVNNLDASGSKSAYLTIAKMMEKNGFDAKRIKMTTGWERGADRKWRYEVPDDITIKPGAVDKIIELVDKGEYLDSEILYNNYDMEELFDAPELYKAYPEMRKYKVRILDMEGGKWGSSWGYAIDLNYRLFTSGVKQFGFKTLLDVVSHEVQHEIQKIEGFAYGSWQDDYWFRTGEVEARNAATRRDMTAEEISQSLGEETEDIPRSMQSIGRIQKVWNAASGEFEDAPMEFREDIKDLETDQETDVLYRRASQGATAQTAAQMYGDKVSTIGNAVHEVLVDEYAPVNALLDALAAESGSKIKDDERVSDMMRETGGKAMQAIREYDKKFLQPMWSAVGEFRKKTGSSINDTETYIGLKSGLERNVVLAKRDAKRDYQAEYDAEIAEIDQEEKSKKKALDKQLKDGTISDVTYAGEMTLLQQEMKKKRDDAETARKAKFADVDAGTDKRFLEYRKKDYSAITAWAETEDLQEAERLAGDYVADMESRAGAGTTKELWKRINSATKETLKFQYEHQILSRQQYQDISKMMDYYVPMRGFSEDTAEDLFNYYVTPQSNDFQATVLTAKGRKTWYEGPLENIGAMHSSAISQGIKNEAKLSLLDAVRRRPTNTIATVTRAWFVKTGQKDANGKDIYEVAYPQVPEGATRAQRESIIEQFEEDMAEAKRNGDAYNAHREVDLHGGVVAFERQSHKNEHVVQVREGGKEYGIIINGNPAAAQAVNGVRRSNGAGEKILGYLRSFTRVLSSMFTTFSVPFWVSNFQRDYGQGLTNASIRNDKGYVGRYIKNRLRAYKLFPYILGSESMDKALAKGDPVAKLYKQYLENGGPMGQNRIEDNEYFERQMKRYLSNSVKQGVIKGATSVLNVIGGVGEAIETITRFAVFMTSMESGRPLHQSISDAKEISTNFARKGSGRSFSRNEIDRMTRADGTRLNAVEKGFVTAMSIFVEICRATIPFFNAAIQGLENKVTNYRTHWGKTLIADSIYLALGFGMKMLLGNAGGDDDKEKYSHISDYLRRNNANTPLGNGVYAKWALPQEYRVMFALGDILASAVQQERPADDLAIDAFGALMQMSPWGVVTEEVAFSPENKKKAYETLITNVSPGVAAPVLESIFNMDFKGARIYNEGFNENLRSYPGWTKALPTTGKEYVAAAKFLNELTGGNDVERGYININPAIVEHLVESYFSGPYQIVVRLPEAAVKIAKGEATVRDVPLLNRIILNTNDNQRDAFYSNMYYYFKELNTEAERIHSEYKERPKEGKVAEFYESDKYKYMLIFNKYDKAERELRKASKQMDEKGDKERKKEYDDRLQDIQYQIAKECLDLYFRRNGKEEVK